ncbi:DUF4492 domain-containing protein [Sulfuricurvum sp. IAE1]|jgi:hypothetical protein|uniref:DUF4492 domain-containing protein n=1 Tax=Sulfuricurvum sp. IAE1 TaxID=2546102 RepID=UPI00104CFD2F|nr:DUF4492 domain-containing protein [Sulfuricurvum sp. IAE1]MDX9967334.1 DUF4492 domain-containing protein [Sulfuricurvum sp.]TDA64168.1 DUF4492 domain-containing protein [Sulfuricurvum sp. IAE1]
MATEASLLRRIADLYIEGFRAMKVGRQLWLLIALKLLILFGVMKILFFPDILNTRFDTDAQRSAHVLENLTKE